MMLCKSTGIDLGKYERGHPEVLGKGKRKGKGRGEGEEDSAHMGATVKGNGTT